MEYTTPLIQTKLQRPRLDGDLVSRPRLIEQLNRGLERPLTLIAAPAGYGKTTLAVSWLQECSYPVAWLSLDDDDNDLIVFVTYIIAAIQSIFPDACPQTQSLGQAPQFPPIDYIATTLINEIADLQEEPAASSGPSFVLVLDDFHTIHNDLINQLMTKIVNNLPLQMHLVICSRIDPRLPLSRLRVHRQIVEIRTIDLCFSQDEVNNFLEQSLGEKQSSEVVALLDEKTEGWVTGLRLAALSMRSTDNPAAFVKTFKGIHFNVMDFLVDEVLSSQPQAVNDFLLQTSILKRFCAPLCEAMTDLSLDESQDILVEIERQNLFLVPLDYERGWYRYHHLFQDLLSHRLQDHLNSDELVTLHCKASEWLAGSGFVGEALWHSLAAGDVEGATRLVEQNRHDALNREDWATLERWLNLLPEETIQERPMLLVARAWILAMRYRAAAIPPLLQAAEACLRTDTDVWAESARNLQGEIDALWSIILVWGGQGKQALERALQAVERILPAHNFARSTAMVFLSLAYQMTGQARTAILKLDEFLAEASAQPDNVIALILHGQVYNHLLTGNFHQAEQIIYQLQQVASRGRLTFSMNVADWALGLINYEWNRLETTKQHFSSVFEHRYQSFFKMVIDSIVGLALVYQAQGRPKKRKDTLAVLDGFALEIGIVEKLHELDSIKARIAISQGNLRPAIRWTETIPVDIPVDYTFVWVELPIISKTRVLIAQGTEGSLREAVRVLQELLIIARSRHNTYRQIGLLALLALAYQAQGQTDDALQALQHSVRLAQPGNFIRTYVDLGPDMAHLLNQLAEGGLEPEYLNQVLAAFDSFAMDRPLKSKESVSTTLMVEPLTQRELEILKLLNAGQSNQEIAQALVISPLTVKRHASNIYTKLGVSGRLKAVTKAKALGILSPD